jgi:hypothetical protein
MRVRFEKYLNIFELTLMEGIAGCCSQFRSRSSCLENISNHRFIGNQLIIENKEILKFNWHTEIRFWETAGVIKQFTTTEIESFVGIMSISLVLSTLITKPVEY